MSSSHQRASTPQCISFKHVLSAEILAVTSAMRKNSRWASSTHFVNPRDSTLASNLGLRVSAPPHHPHSMAKATAEGDLMSGFQALRRAIRDVADVTTLPLPEILAPFFAIIRSPLSTGPITSTALAAIHNFFVRGLVSPVSVALEPALIELSSTVSHCKFEASDSSGDEVVLLRIMTVIQDCLCGSVGAFLGDVEVCEMLETVLTTCCQIRLSETLRKYAETTMHALVRTVFSRLHEIDPIKEEAKLIQANTQLQQQNEIRMKVSTADGSATPGHEASEHGEVRPNVDARVSPPHASAGVHGLQDDTPIVAGERTQFGLPSILELLRVLANVLDPNDQSHTDSTRLIALSTLNSAIESSGPSISHFPSLESVILDPGCKFLFQLARSENMSVLHLALRTITSVFETMKKHLKLQQELFLSFTLDRLAPPQGVAVTKPHFLTGSGSGALLKHKSPNISRPSTPGTPVLSPQDLGQSSENLLPATPPRAIVPPAARGETREILLETLAQLSRQPSFMVDLYTNYDCDINCENLFERLVDFLTKGVYSAAGASLDGQRQQQNSQFLCLDILLGFISDMAMRNEGASESWPIDFPVPESLIQTKSRKKLVLTGAALFNTKPKSGLTFLEENKLIYTDCSPETTRPQSLAAFLKGCTRIDKRLLGDYISKPENIEVLKAFIGLFDFKDKPMADAMRELLETFRLPGEAQQIARITETFASIYFASQPAEIKSEDAVYVLAYSIIMLNTDLHNPQIRKRMTIEDYKKNLRGVNGGSDFSAEYLQTIYDSIRKREIVMPEEHTGQLGFEYAWKELLARSRQSGNLMICNTSMFDHDMFKSVWKPVISAMSYAFVSFEDDYLIQRAITGLRQCANLARRLELPDVFDFIVLSLSQATSLLSDPLLTHVPNFPVVQVEGQSITVSSLSVKFGTNFKGQLAAVVLFNIVNGNGNALREGWTQIFEIFQNLFMHSLLPMRMLQMEDFLGGVSMIPLQGSQPARPAARSDGGLLFALSSYLMTPYSSSHSSLVPEATDADVENTLCTIDCITSCRFDELYGEIMQLESDALIAAVRSLEALAHERTVARLRQESDDIGSPFSDVLTSLPYDPASVFLLEMMVSIACRTPHHIEEIWPIVFEHLSALLSASTHYSILLIERAVVGLLRLCLMLAPKPSLRDQLYVSFDLLAGLPSTVANSVGEQIVGGVNLVVQKHRDVIRSQTEWNLVFALLRSTISNPAAAHQSFELIVGLASKGPTQTVNSDNFTGLITLLDEFATLAGSTLENQQRQGRQRDATDPPNTPSVSRGRRSVDILSEMKSFIPSLTENASVPQLQAWRQYCLHYLASLSRQSTNSSREIRYTALSQLSRALLGPHILCPDNPPAQVEEIFNRVIFPLLDDLLRPQVFQRDPEGMPETRLRASALLCKAFMHFEVREPFDGAELRIVWMQILDLLDRLMNADVGDQLYEAVPESLKNVLLVMNAAGILVPPSDDDQRDERQRNLWTATQQRMERFLPGFLVDVISIPQQSAPHAAVPAT